MSPQIRSNRPLRPAANVAGLLLALCAAPAAAAQAPSQETPGAGTAAESPRALTIDGEAIPLATFEDWLLNTRGELMAAAFGRVVAIRREARARGVGVEPTAIEDAVQSDVQVRVDNVFAGDRSRWVAELESAQRTEAGYLTQQRSDVELQLLATELANIGRVVSEDKIVRDWELQYGPRGVRLGVRGLKRSVELVATRPGLTVDERRVMIDARAAEATAELEALRARIEAGETLAFLAKQSSDDEATAARGGLFDGPFDGIGWPGDLVDALLDLPLGQVSEPLRGRGGVWLFEVVSRRETPLETVRDELHRALVEAGPEGDEVNACLAELFGRTTIEVGAALIERRTEDRTAPAVIVDGQAEDLASYAAWLRLQQGELMARRFAEERLIARLAADAGITPTAAEIEAKVEEDRRRIVDLGNDGDEAKWIESLARGGRTVESWTRGARHRALVALQTEALWRRDRVISDEEVKNLWADRYGIDGISVAARLIAKRFEMPEREADESERAYRSRVMQAAEPKFNELVELSARVEDGEDFASLAQRYSDDAESAPLGGSPPGGFDLTTWDEAARIALSGLQPGDLTPPVLIDDTLYLFEVTEYVATPLEDVAAALRAELETSTPPGVTIAAFRNVLTRDLDLEIAPAMFR